MHSLHLQPSWLEVLLLLNVLLHSEFHIQNVSNIQKYQAPVNMLVSNGSVKFFV